jgi:hypothetical protein
MAKKRRSSAMMTGGRIPLAKRNETKPIFEADLPPEQYAYRPGRNATLLFFGGSARYSQSPIDAVESAVITNPTLTSGE